MLISAERNWETRHTSYPHSGYLRVVHMLGEILSVISTLPVVTSTPWTVLFHHFHFPSKSTTHLTLIPGPSFSYYFFIVL